MKYVLSEALYNPLYFSDFFHQLVKIWTGPGWWYGIYQSLLLRVRVTRNGSIYLDFFFSFVSVEYEHYWLGDDNIHIDSGWAYCVSETYIFWWYSWCAFSSCFCLCPLSIFMYSNVSCMHNMILSWSWTLFWSVDGLKCFSGRNRVFYNQHKPGRETWTSCSPGMKQ